MISKLSNARLLPVVILSLAVFAALKAGNLWYGVSSAGAETPLQTPSEPTVEERPSEVERRILEKLAARRTALDAREEALSAREAVIAAAEKKLGTRIADFERRRDAFDALSEIAGVEEADEIEALVSAYERMKAKDAAVIFNALDQDILVSVSSRMRTQALAGVLAAMDPEKARALTVLHAQGEENAPFESAADAADE